VLTATYVEPAGHVVPAPFAPGGAASAPRRLKVEVRYPSSIAPSDGDTPLAPPEAGGPFPTVVFAPGLNEDPPPYQPLLHDWAQAGFVVAATTFPVTSPSVPNAGDKERDLPNQPYDVKFLIDSLSAAAANPSDPLHPLIDPAEIALSGQSDGGNTTVATSYNTAYQDNRIKAAVVLSGARYGYPGGTWFPAGSPPLLATQGTADTINPPSLTNDFFSSDPYPNKYLLCLPGAPHLDPYVTHNNYERAVAQVSSNFLYAELYHLPESLQAMTQVGTVAGVATFASRC
jgi:dienelactone hydrolase